MRKLLVVLILVFVPLQLTWAAIGNYCQHETGSGAAHMGHHVHKHDSQSKESGHANAVKTGSTDADCSTCHAGCSLALASEGPAMAQLTSMNFGATYQLPTNSLPLGIPERPQWPFLAQAGLVLVDALLAHGFIQKPAVRQTPHLIHAGLIASSFCGQWGIGMFVAFLGRAPRIRWWLVATILIALDQATKAYFSNAIPLGSAIEVTGWFNLVHVLNTGAAFSLAADAGGWQRPFLIFISLLVVVPVAVVCMTKQVSRFERWVGAALVAGGGGNLADRIQTGAVVDFLDVHWKALHWPAFNLADVYVVCALAAWVWFTLRQRETSDADPAPQVPRP